MRICSSVACLAATAFAALAQPHSGDIVLQLEDGQVVTTTSDFDPRCTFGGQFGTGDQTNDPGFDSGEGEFPSNSEMGFTILAALREWDGSDFDTVSDERLEMSWGPLGPVVSPPDDTPVEGFTLGVSGDGEFHYHYKFKLSAPADPGVYLLTFQMWSDEQSIAPSEPIYLLLNQDSGQSVFDEAFEWWEQHGAWCSASGCVGDFNGDGTVNTIDVITFLNAYTAGDPSADINGDGVINTIDVIEFLNAWNTGC